MLRPASPRQRSDQLSELRDRTVGERAFRHVQQRAVLVWVRVGARVGARLRLRVRLRARVSRKPQVAWQ